MKHLTTRERFSESVCRFYIAELVRDFSGVCFLLCRFSFNSETPKRLVSTTPYAFRY